jgi:hypothetical protein
MAWWFSQCKIPIKIVGIEDVKKDFFPKTFFSKVIRKLKYYKVNFLRGLFKIYK